MRTLALPKEVEHWSLTALREKLIKIGAKVVRHGRYVTLQLAEVAVPRGLFRKILSLIDDLRPRPAPAQAGEIHGRVKTTGGVCLNGGNLGKWPSKRGPITKTLPSVGCGKTSVLAKIGWWYIFPEFGYHLGNVG